jgi:hypothetical protein
MKINYKNQFKISVILKNKIKKISKKIYQRKK